MKVYVTSKLFARKILSAISFRYRVRDEEIWDEPRGTSPLMSID